MKTKSLTGRRLVEGDLSFVVEVWNDERVAPMIGGARTEQQLTDRIARWTRHWNEHGFGATLFQDSVTSLPVGWGGLQRSTLGIGERLTVGYVLAPDAWGHGYATEIAGVSVTHAFSVLGANEVYASVLATNAASRRVLEKVGLVVDLEIDHGDHVGVIYVTVRSDVG